MPAYKYRCENPSCEVDTFKLRKLMSQYKDPGECPSCGAFCARLPTDLCTNLKCVGAGWVSTTGSYATDPRQVNLDVDSRINRKNNGSGE